MLPLTPLTEHGVPRPAFLLSFSEAVEQSEAVLVVLDSNEPWPLQWLWQPDSQLCEPVEAAEAPKAPAATAASPELVRYSGL